MNYNVFGIAIAACCAIHKAASIPEVETMKLLLDPLIRARVEQLADRLIDELTARLGRIPVPVATRMKPEVVAALLTAALADAEGVFALPFDRNLRDAVREAVDVLLAAGGRSTGTPDLGSALVPIQAAAAERELVLLIQEAVVGGFGDLRGLLGRFLTEGTLRGGQSILGAASVFDQQVTRVLVPSKAITAAIDTWAYGTFMAGTAVATDLRGVTGFRLRATTDGRETAFCHWVNGRIVPATRALRQLEKLRQAALTNNREALIAARPFLPSHIAKNGNELQFEQFFRRAGLPPFHFGCRTVPIPVRD